VSSRVYVKASPKAAAYGFKVLYQLHSDGTCDIWAADRVGFVGFRETAKTPEAAFSTFYRWLKRHADGHAEGATQEPEPEPEPVAEVSDLASLVAQIDRLVMRLDALLDRADAIFSHADKVLQELS
jgi:hypothetical protein